MLNNGSEISLTTISGLGNSGIGGSYIDNFSDYLQYFEFSGALTSMPGFLSNLGSTFTRNSSQLVLQGSQYVTLAADQFGTHYDQTTDKYWYLSELAATNLLTYSHDFSNALYTKNEVTVGASVDSPFGAGTGTRLVASTNNAAHHIRPTTQFGSGVLTTRYWILKADYRYVGFGANYDSDNLVVLDLQNGSVVQDSGTYAGRCGIIPITSGWYIAYVHHSSAVTQIRQPRLYILGDSYTPGVSGSTAAFAGDGTRGVYACHCQQETGDQPTSPIRTAGATASRSATVLQTALSNISGFSAAKYTLQVSFRMHAISANAENSLASISDGSTNNRLTLRVNGSNQMEYIASSGGATVATVTDGTAGITSNKIAVSCTTDSFLSSFNGVAGTADTSGAMPVLPTTFYIGAGAAGTNQPNALIGSVALITTNLTQSQINDITS